MSIIKFLASSLNRTDEIPNQELAETIANKKDKAAIKELVENLENKSKDIQHDCIKVLYEIALLNPELVTEHLKVFVDLLNSKNNRLQWGAMTALNHITSEYPGYIHKSLAKILDAVDNGSVITKDHGMNILI